MDDYKLLACAQIMLEALQSIARLSDDEPSKEMATTAILGVMAVCFDDGVKH